MHDPFHLERFVHAQHPTYPAVIRELTAGEKRSHWMWFIFPQIAGLGSSPTAQRYALSGLTEARAYLAHPVLGPRLLECTALVNAASARTLDQIFGCPDDLKLHSCITLFAQAAPAGSPFHTALRTFFAGREDAATLARLKP